MRNTHPHLYLYYLGIFVLICFFVTLMIAYAVFKEQKPLSSYNSQVDAMLLNDVIALSIVPLETEFQTSENQFTLDNFYEILSKDFGCEQTIFNNLSPKFPASKLIQYNIIAQKCDVDCQLQLTVERLKNLNKNVYDASQMGIQRGKLNQPMHIGLTEFVQNTCAAIGKTQVVKDSYGASKVTITPFHVLSSIKQFNSAAENLMQRGNLYWCAAYRDDDVIGENIPAAAKDCHADYRHVMFASNALAVRNPWSGLKGCIAFATDSLSQNTYFLSNKRGRSNLHTQLDTHCATLFGLGSDLVDNDALSQKEQDDAATNVAVKDNATSVDTSKNSQALSIIQDEPVASDLTNMAWGIPKDFDLMLRVVNPLRRADDVLEVDEQGEVVNVLKDNTVEINGFDYPIGLHVQTTIVPEVQAMAQQVAVCYTGNLEVCDGLGINTTNMQSYYENAAARRVGIAIVDAKTGNIEALASSHTPCFEQDHTTVKKKEGCPTINYKPRFSQDQLNNYAFYGEAQPASTVKPLMTLAFLPDYTDQQITNLKTELIKSDSKSYTKRLFCEKGYLSDLNDCPFTERLVNITTGMGANRDCGVQDAKNPWLIENTLGCGKADLTLGNLDYVDLGTLNKGKVPQTPTLYYRYGVERNDDAIYGISLTEDFTVKKVAKDGKTLYRNKQADLNSTLGLGQGSSQVSPVGVAGMYAHIVNAANNESTQVIPHLVDKFIDVEGNTPQLLIDKQIYKQQIPIAVSANDATQLLNMMSANPHSSGTGHRGCVYSFSEDLCNSMTQVAGKTGTPTFKLNSTNQRPLKWYAAAFKSDPNNTNFDKTLAVLIERNWTTKNSLLGERNNAAYVAFSFIKLNNNRLEAMQASDLQTYDPIVAESIP